MVLKGTIVTGTRYYWPLYWRAIWGNGLPWEEKLVWRELGWSWVPTIYIELLRHILYQNDPLFKPDRTVSLVFGSVGQFFGNSLRKCVVGCFFLNILIYLNISTHMGSRLVYSAPKWQVKNHKTIIKMISTNLLAIPALGDAFSVSSFCMLYIKLKFLIWQISCHITLDLESCQ